MNDRTVLLLDELENALERLEDALSRPYDEYLRDSCIQRFEFTFELLWKAIKSVAQTDGLSVSSPREALRTAYKMGLLADDRGYLDMLEDRNLTSHTYKEATADEIYARLPGHATRARAALVAMRAKEE
jgi:nucleotidyltransferase substrate binding protein (TIGR01987 family)